MWFSLFFDLPFVFTLKVKLWCRSVEIWAKRNDVKDLFILLSKSYEEDHQTILSNNIVACVLTNIFLCISCSSLFLKGKRRSCTHSYTFPLYSEQLSFNPSFQILLINNKNSNRIKYILRIVSLNISPSITIFVFVYSFYCHRKIQYHHSIYCIICSILLNCLQVV